MPNFLTPYMTALKIALAVALFAAGFFVAGHFYQNKIDSLHEDIGSYEATIRSMGAVIIDQNDGIEAMRKAAAERDAAAQQAIATAVLAQQDAERKAHAILAKRPPKNSDECSAASAAFDDELTAERRAQ